MYKTLKHDLDKLFVGVQSMFNMVPGACASDATTAFLNQAVAGFSDSFFRSSFNCSQEAPVWSGTTDVLDRAIFCGYKQVSPPPPPPPLPLLPPSPPPLPNPPPVTTQHRFVYDPEIQNQES